MKSFSRKDTNLCLVILLAIDIVFFIGHLALIVYDWGGPFMSLTEEGGIPEMYQYLKFILIILMCGFLIIKKNQHVFIFWFLLFALFFIDDAFEFHETGGAFLMNVFDLKAYWGLRAQDWGELTYAALCGLALIPLLIFAYVKGSDRTKKVFLDIGILLGLFLFFAIVVDMVHSYFTEAQDNISYFFGMLEDGGEMILLSIMVWYFYFLIKNSSDEQVYLHQYLLPSK